jgi:hypothetical protein
MSLRPLCWAMVFAALGSGCVSGAETEKKQPPAPASWAWAARTPGAALLGVHGTASDDVWLVGADDGKGPLVLHFDGQTWLRHATGVRGDLWWVHAVENGPVLFGGTDGMLLSYASGAFERLPTPALGKHTVFGVWAAAADDVYVVGATAGRNGFIWHYDGAVFEAIALPAGLPEDSSRDAPGLFKVWGSSADEVWVVGARGTVLRGNARAGFELVQSGGEETLFTVHGHAGEVAIVGGGSAGMLLGSKGGAFMNETPASAPLLQGVCVADDGTTWAVGYGGSVYQRQHGVFQTVDTGLDFAAAESLHSVWVDPEGGVWAVGGDVLTPELDQGLALHRGAAVPRITIEPDATPAAVCPEAAIDPVPSASIARRWNEQILGAIRRDIPRPTVHARNLFHVSVAFWDAWSAYDEQADGYMLRERQKADAVDTARQEAISYAAYRVLRHRYSTAVGGAVSAACFDAFMQKLGYDPTDTSDSGNEPRALGNRIGAAIIASSAEDGANEQNDYADPENFVPDGPALAIDRPGTETNTPTLWQPLVLAKAETQNGIAASAGAQRYIGAQWGQVTPFSLERPTAGAAYLDMGTPSVELDAVLVEAVVDVLRRSSELDIADGTMIDISPGAMGNNPLGTNAGRGYRENPVTGKAYTPQRVLRGDFGRVLAEFWADGPASETPPGHWNTLANHVADHPDFSRRLFGEGDTLDPLAWDVHLYLALNGAVHDAAIAAWELKRKYLSARPITLIRYLAARGQRTDATAANYDPEGIPLVPDLIESITEQSAAPGERHAELSRYVGEIAVRSWRGEPGDRRHQIGGVAWVRAAEWIPYQRRTFVTPAFPGYVSGHSTFSRASAVVLAELTGSPYFPGGHARQEFDPGYLFFEQGPSSPLALEWATYYDAADQAGQSRIWGGIHLSPDDFDGRRVGALVGTSAIATARSYFEGTAAR